ncbi:BNR-4 repeat-containing protein [Planctomycetota bacterium]
MAYRVFLFVVCVLAAFHPSATAGPPVITFNDDGGWCWFEDERAIVHNGKLIIGSVAAGSHDATRKGNVEVVSYDLKTAELKKRILHPSFEFDDHDSPAFSVLADGHILAMYAKHGRDNKIHFRVTEQPGDISSWKTERTFVPSKKSRVTYSNLVRFNSGESGGGRLFNFYRGYDASFKPSWMTSDDNGQSWTAHGLWIDFPAKQRHRPYVKFISNNKDTIHFVFTEGHPRNFNNSLFHAYYRNGAYHRSDGTRVKAVTDGPITPAEATKIFAGSENSVAWPCDLHLDDQARPVVAYSVQEALAELPSDRTDVGLDHRYRVARWDGDGWQDREVAFAGTRLYKGEDDYTGLICLDPNDTNCVFLSSNVNIQTGAPNSSGHYEIYQGKTRDAGLTWRWTAITESSDVDNLRPIVPISNGDRTILLWLRGRLHTYTDYDLDVVGIVFPAEEQAQNNSRESVRY